MLSGQTANPPTSDMLLQSVKPLLEMDDQSLLLFLSTLSRKFLKLCSEKRNKLVAAGFVKKAKLLDLWPAVNMREAKLELSAVLDLAFLESVKPFINPTISKTVTSCLNSFKRLPLMFNHNLLNEIHKQLAIWDSITLKNNGLYGFFIKLLSMLDDLDKVTRCGSVADEFLITLCCLKIICELKDERYLEEFRDNLIAVEAMQTQKGHQLENEALAAELKTTTAIAYLTSSTQVMEMMASLFSVDSNLNVVLNLAYFNQVVAYIQNLVSFDHMEKKHKATTCGLYQFTMFNSAIKKLREIDILDAESEDKVRNKYWVRLRG